MFRFAFIATAVSLIVLTACGNDNEAASTATVLPPSNSAATVVPVTPVAKPPAVPQTARPIGQTTTLGRIVRRANESPLGVMTRRLRDAACQDDILVIETSEETIYASLPCDSFWDATTVEAFSGQQVAIVLEVTEARFRVLIETLAEAQAEFTVAGIWVE